jgi:hypothetical protein
MGVLIKRLLLLSLAISLAAAAGCRNSRPELTGEQRQIAEASEAAVDGYLASNVGTASFGGKVFCAHEVLDVESKGERVNEYVFAVCQEYGVSDGSLREGTGVGIPVAVEMERRGRAFQVVAHQVPGDSPRYAGDVKRIFPEKTHDEIFYGDRKSLIEAVERKAKTSYGIR